MLKHRSPHSGSHRVSATTSFSCTREIRINSCFTIGSNRKSWDENPELNYLMPTLANAQLLIFRRDDLQTLQVMPLSTTHRDWIKWAKSDLWSTAGAVIRFLSADRRKNSWPLLSNRIIVGLLDRVLRESLKPVPKDPFFISCTPRSNDIWYISGHIPLLPFHAFNSWLRIRASGPYFDFQFIVNSFLVCLLASDVG